MNLCPRCGTDSDRAAAACAICSGVERRTAPAPPAPAAGAVALLRRVEVTLGSAAFLLVGYLLGTTLGIIPQIEVAVRPDPGAAATFLAAPMVANPPPPFVLELANARVIDLRTGDHFDAPFEVRDPRPCILTAQILAGSGRDVEVYVLDEDGYHAWRSGVRPRAVFASGRATHTALDVALPGRGRYHLLLSNRYSIFTPKKVTVEDARLRCA